MSDFIERQELLTLKAMLVWMRMRYAVSLKEKIPQNKKSRLQVIFNLRAGKKFALIKASDAWIIERNACLLSMMAKTLAFKVLPEKAYKSYGGVATVVSRKMNAVELYMINTAIGEQVKGVPPCSMHIVEDSALVKLFRDKEKDTSTQVDIIPFLKQCIPLFLSASETNLINEAYAKYKNDPVVVKDRENVERIKSHEDKNLQTVLSKIDAVGGNKEAHTLAVLMHHIVDSAYSVDPQNVTMIRYQPNISMVKEFSQLFVVQYETDLNYIRDGLQNVVANGIRVLTDGNRILFTTTLTEVPDAPRNASNTNEYLNRHHINSIVVETVEAFNHHFEMCVAPTLDLDVVDSVLSGFMVQDSSRGSNSGEA